MQFVYGTLGIGLVEMADRLRCDIDELKRFMAAAGVQLRGQGRDSASRAWQMDPDELRALYVEQARPVTEIAQRLGVSETFVYRALHQYRLPVPAPGRGEPRVRFDELIADARIAKGLADGGVTPAAPGPPTRGTPLPATVLQTLLVDLELSTFDVELLTGRRAAAVRRDCATAGVPLPRR